MSALIVIGTSVGGLSALRKLFAGLGTNFPSPILVVQHVGAHPSRLPALLSSPRMTFRHAREGDRLRPGMFLVAPPDRHLLVEDGVVCLSNSAKEHHTRPAVDPLFRSSALAWGADVIGVVLTGALSDGTAGLQAIKAMGGIAIVQDPDEAEEAGMPSSALEHCVVDHCVRLAEMAPLLTRLASGEAFLPRPAPITGATHRRELLEHEAALGLGKGDPMEHLQAIGEPSTLTCPDCQGVLWKIKGSSPLRFRCHTGHAFTGETLDMVSRATSEDTLWQALRSLQERHALLEMLRHHERRERHVAQLDEALENLHAQSHALHRLIEHHHQPERGMEE